MELIHQLRLLTIPKPVQYIIVLIMILLLGINLYIGYHGIVDQSRDKWVEAGAFLLGNLLPMFALAMILCFSYSGVPALQNKCHVILTRFLPQILKGLEDYPHDFYTKHRTSLPILPSRVKTEVCAERGRCDAEYKLYIPTGDLHKSRTKPPEYLEVLFRLELNVHKANLCLYFHRDGIERLAKSAEGGEKKLTEWLRHSLDGARFGAGAPGDAHQATRYAYEVNETITHHEINGSSYQAMVLRCALPERFMYETAEQLFFCQDLMFFLKSMVRERPELHKTTVAPVIWPA